ncbi:ParM/StbA family protein [Aneurinibacillus tyrosinisolvens]|uniref:ParM/StbA family protein n=1 Tax=Aneurinibacillus tyrosinisolvens TaxID=1443435 RepID=UPI00063EEBAF|nr:ParM/StbA family protein [Aneurinibacillus tyrosinisolvens]
MTNQLSIAIDSGKHSTKSASYINGTLQKVRFRTKVQGVENLGIDIPMNNYLLELEGNSFLIGDSVSENRSDFSLSKNTKEHLLCIYLSIVKFLEKMGLINSGIPTIRLAVNLPLSHYKNAKFRQEYEESILNSQKPISLRINQKPFIFRIQSVLFLPEGTGPIYSRISEYRNKRVLIFDIGSLNVNFCEYQSLVPRLDSMFLSTQGINILRSKITEELTTKYAKYGISISQDDAEQILRDGYLFANGIKQEESKAVIEDCKSSHVVEIFNFAKSRGLTFNNSILLFCGGGSIILKEAILSEFPSAVIDTDGVYANVLSYLKIMEAKGLVKA